MSRACVAILFLALAACSKGIARGTPQPDEPFWVKLCDHLERGQSLLKAKDYPTAITEFGEGLEVVNPHGDKWYNIRAFHRRRAYCLEGRADCFVALKEEAKAIRDYEAALNLISPFAGDYDIVKLKDKIANARIPGLDAALAAAERRVVEQPGSADALVDRAVAIFNRGSSGYAERALADARRAAELAPKSPAPRWVIGDILLDQADWAGAKAAYLEGEAIFPRGNALGLYRLGLLAERGKDPEEAMKFHQWALTAETYRQTSNLRRMPKPVLLVKRQRGDCLIQLGRLQLMRGIANKSDPVDIQAALKSYKEAVFLDPRDFNAHHGQHEATFRLGLYSEVLALGENLRRVAKENPEIQPNDDRWAVVAWAEGVSAWHLEKWDLLRDRMRFVTEGRNSNIGFAWQLRALASEHLSLYADAAKFMQKARQLDAKLPAIALPNTERWVAVEAQDQALRREWEENQRKSAKMQAERDKLTKSDAPFDWGSVRMPSPNSGWGSSAQSNSDGGAYLESKIRASLQGRDPNSVAPVGGKR